MQLKRYNNNPILKPRKNIPWEASAVFNPSVVFHNGTFHMLYRALPKGIKPFITHWGKPGYRNFISFIGYAKSTDGIHFTRYLKPFIKPSEKYDLFGCEDPRITKLGDTFYIFYTAINRPVYEGKTFVVPKIALATTKDFITIKKYGVVGPNIASKAGVLFPKKILGKFAMLLTPKSDSPLSSISLAYFKSMEELFLHSKIYWEKFLKTLPKHFVMDPPKGSKRGPETGAAPIKTKKGWLFIYCGEDYRISGKKEWNIKAALLDLKNPQKIIAKTKEPILRPEKKYELNGIVPNVTFPEGAVIVGDKLYVYYGGADSCCCLATCDVNKLLNSLA